MHDPPPSPTPPGRQWLWDMVDEFVYQFQDFCRFRSKDLKKRTPAELDALAAAPRVWDTMEARAPPPPTPTPAAP